MDPTLYDICARSVTLALHQAIIKDPLRGITSPPVRKAFLNDVRTNVRRLGYGCEVDTFLKGGAPTVVVTLRVDCQGVTSYSATFDSQMMADVLNLRQCRLTLPTSC